MSIRLLMAECSAEERQAFCEYMSDLGFAARAIARPDAVEQALARAPADVVLLSCTGVLTAETFAVAARLRQASQVGVILLADTVRPEERLRALSLGVDHCLARPLGLHELEVIIRNLYRHVRTTASSAPVYAAEKRQEIWVCDPILWTLIAPNGKTVQLSLLEYHFLGALFAKASMAASREELLAALNRPNLEAYRRNIDVFVARLRKKVITASGRELPVRSARGMGYVFAGRTEMLK